MGDEKNFENRVKRFLKDNGCWFIKYWGGAAYTKSGVPDLLVSCSGRFVGVELKSCHGRPSPLQVVNLREIDRSGGYAVLLYPDNYMLFQNFILCIRAKDWANAAYDYGLLKPKWEHFENKIEKGED